MVCGGIFGVQNKVTIWMSRDFLVWDRLIMISTVQNFCLYIPREPYLGPKNIPAQTPKNRFYFLLSIFLLQPESQSLMHAGQLKEAERTYCLKSSMPNNKVCSLLTGSLLHNVFHQAKNDLQSCSEHLRRAYMNYLTGQHVRTLWK